MLLELQLAELELPYLLTQPQLWQSLFINYEKPFVERLWCPWKEYRLNLHRLLPCEAEECFVHPHPWPSAMKIVKGNYRMSVSYGAGLKMPPVDSMMFDLTAGSSYDMTDPNMWHAVQPLDEPVWSIMLTGRPWGRAMPKSERITLSSLPEYKIEEMFAFYRKLYV